MVAAPRSTATDFSLYSTMYKSRAGGVDWFQTSNMGNAVTVDAPGSASPAQTPFDPPVVTETLSIIPARQLRSLAQSLQGDGDLGK